MMRDEFEATLTQARKFGGFGLDPYFGALLTHDAEQRQVIGNLYNRLALLKADDAERCTLIRDMEEEERKKDGEIEEQRQEIVRLREALKDAMNLIDVDNLTTQTVYRNCQQALKETTE